VGAERRTGWGGHQHHERALTKPLVDGFGLCTHFEKYMDFGYLCSSEHCQPCDRYALSTVVEALSAPPPSYRRIVSLISSLATL
jgi:hypothetical protein